jgi:hypothetical protein
VTIPLAEGKLRMERCSSAVPGEDRGCSRQRKGLRTSRTHRKERDDNRSGLAQPRQISPVETTRSVLYRSGPLDRELNAFCQSKRSARSPQLAPRRRAGLPHVAGCGRGQFDTADAVRFASVSRALRISVKCLPNRPAVRLCRHAQLLPPSASWASRRRLCFGPYLSLDDRGRPVVDGAKGSASPSSWMASSR